MPWTTIRFAVMAAYMFVSTIAVSYLVVLLFDSLFPLTEIPSLMWLPVLAAASLPVWIAIWVYSLPFELRSEREQLKRDIAGALSELAKEQERSTQLHKRVAELEGNLT